MATITRSSVLLNEADYLGINNAVGAVASEMNDKVAPVFDIGHRHTVIVKAATSAISASGTSIYVLPSNKDFYLTFIDLSVTKDAACDGVVVSVDGTILNLRTKIVTLCYQATTAGDYQKVIAFPHPIKLDRGSSLLLLGTFTAGNCSKYVTIGGFIVE